MKKVIILFHSQEYGNTAACAELVAQGVRTAGGANIQLEMINTNTVNRVDMSHLAACDGLAIGSPDYMSYVAGTIEQVFDDIYIAQKTGIVVEGKPCALFMTHGGGGAGLKALRSLAHGFKLVANPFSCEGAPGECVDAIALGEKLGQVVLESH
jgi:flavorubredoxin